MTVPADLPSLISEGRRLIEEATKGRVLVNEYYHAVQTHEPGVPLAAVCYQGNTPAAEADLRRIVFAVNALPQLLAVAEAAELAVQDLGNVLYNIETGERRAAEEQATEIRARLDAALRGEVKP